MLLSRIIEICFSILTAFVIICVISFSTLRPMLHEVREEVKTEWDSFVEATHERNDSLPGLVEALRGFETGHSKLLNRLIEARSISMRPIPADRFVEAVDEMDNLIEQIGKLKQTTPQLAFYPPFQSRWNEVESKSVKVRVRRIAYNNRVRLYNGLLRAFPQNLVSSLFGFVPLSLYPTTLESQ